MILCTFGIVNKFHKKMLQIIPTFDMFHPLTKQMSKRIIDTKMKISTKIVSFSLFSSIWRKKFVMEGWDSEEGLTINPFDPNQMRC